MVCQCKHRKSFHDKGTGACRKCDCKAYVEVSMRKKTADTWYVPQAIGALRAELMAQEKTLENFGPGSVVAHTKEIDIGGTKAVEVAVLIPEPGFDQQRWFEARMQQINVVNTIADLELKKQQEQSLEEKLKPDLAKAGFDDVKVEIKEETEDAGDE